VLNGKQATEEALPFPAFQDEISKLYKPQKRTLNDYSKANAVFESSRE
jgi:hypothetical protein